MAGSTIGRGASARSRRPLPGSRRRFATCLRSRDGLRARSPLESLTHAGCQDVAVGHLGRGQTSPAAKDAPGPALAHPFRRLRQGTRLRRSDQAHLVAVCRALRRAVDRAPPRPREAVARGGPARPARPRASRPSPAFPPSGRQRPPGPLDRRASCRPALAGASSRRGQPLGGVRHRRHHRLRPLHAPRDRPRHPGVDGWRRAGDCAGHRPRRTPGGQGRRSRQGWPSPL